MTLIKYTPAQQAAIAVKNGDYGVGTRRLIVQALGDTFAGSERTVLDASVKTPISDLDKETLVKALSTAFKYIAIDIGYNIQSQQRWQYMQTRFTQVLMTYYSHLSVSDIKAAFELMSIGVLDDYLPHDYLGNADKRHYQSLSIEYFTRILNAYNKYRTQILAKAIDALPVVKDETKEDMMNRQFLSEQEKRNRGIFLKYKYTGRYTPESFDEIFLVEWLSREGLIESLEITIEDKKKAYSAYMAKIAKGLVSDFQASVVRFQRENSQYIETETFLAARSRIVKEAFDLAIKEEIQLCQ